MISYQLLFGKWNLLTHICRNSIAPSLVWHVRVHEEIAVILLLLLLLLLFTPQRKEYKQKRDT